MTPNCQIDIREIRRRVQDHADSIVDADPVAWADRLGVAHWSMQREIARSLLDYRSTVVVSCNGTGKTFWLAFLMLWWCNYYPAADARVVVTGPGYRTVAKGLWDEAKLLHAAHGLPGRITENDYKIPFPNPDSRTERRMAYSFAAADQARKGRSTTTGAHAKHLLVIVEEAGGLSEQANRAIETYGAGGTPHYCRIGNPEIVGTPYYRASLPESGHHVINVGADDCPAFTGESVEAPLEEVLINPEFLEQQARDHGTESDVYACSVLGKFPTESSLSYYPLAWVDRAHAADLEPAPDDPIILGCDIGGGGDPTEVYIRQGPRARRVTPVAIRHSPDGGVVGTGIADLAYELGAAKVVIDSLGDNGADALQACSDRVKALCRSQVDELREVKREKPPRGLVSREQRIATRRRDASLEAEVAGIKQARPRVVGVNTGAPADNSERYANIKAEIHDAGRQRLREGSCDLDPLDHVLTQELLSARSAPPIGKREKVELKVHEIKRLGHSPDRRDAWLLTFADKRRKLRLVVA